MAEPNRKLRILASNPDTLGDLVLRQPMYARLAAAGHEPVLLVRESVVEAIPTILPGVQCIPLQGDPYQLQIEDAAAWCDDMLQVAKSLTPDLLLVAGFQWTLLEERLARELEPVPVVAMNGHVFRGDPEWGQPLTSALRVDHLVEVDEDSSELEKYRRLCAAVLGIATDSLQLPEPVVRPRPQQQEEARALIARHGLEAGEYVVAVVGDHRHSAVRNWRVEDWGTVLARWAREHGRRFVFLGTEVERQTALRVAAAMGEQATAALLLMGQGITLDTVIGLLDSAHSYIGRDTGPLHLAAALGKPAITIFGGGHWPRFVPAGSVHVLTTGLPCFKCDWKCPFEEAHCIRSVPVDQVTAAIALLERGAIRRAVKVLNPPAALYEQMIRSLRQRVEDRTRALGALEREQHQQQVVLQHEHQLNQRLTRELSEAQRLLLDTQGQLLQARQETVAALARADALNQELQKRLTTRIANYLRTLRRPKRTSQQHGTS